MARLIKIPAWSALFETKNPPYRHILELEADYLAMYLLARSGIDAGGYPDFWQRISPSTQFAKVHVMEEGRIENMKAVQEEIDRKLKSNLPLEPTRDKKVEDTTKALYANRLLGKQLMTFTRPPLESLP